MDSLKRLIKEILPEITRIRHHLHQHPELSDHEERTAALVAQRLRELGLEPRTSVGGHGVLAEIAAPREAPMVALRADMDALPIQEENDLPYRSVHDGVMHACGHDGHTAILLGVAELLVRLREQLPVSVRLIFQPAEETVGGAQRMCQAGAMDGVSAVVALHGWVHLPVGHVGIRSGPAMAAADTFDIVVQGQGAHAAYPHLARDPILTGARLVSALQAAVSRETDPLEPVVLTVAQFHAGTAYNIIPAEAHLAGTVRTLSSATRARMEEAVHRIADGVARSAGCSCNVTYRHGAPPVVNDPRVVSLVRKAAEEAVGTSAVSDLVQPSMGAEDFAYYLEYAPGVMFRLGIGDRAPGHTSRFDFDDAALPAGMEVLARFCLNGIEDAVHAAGPRPPHA